MILVIVCLSRDTFLNILVRDQYLVSSPNRLADKYRVDPEGVSLILHTRFLIHIFLTYLSIFGPHYSMLLIYRGNFIYFCTALLDVL